MKEAYIDQIVLQVRKTGSVSAGCYGRFFNETGGVWEAESLQAPENKALGVKAFEKSPADC